MKKKILVGVPDRLLDQLDLLAQYRSQTRSELIREALRSHVERTEYFSPPRPAISVLPHPSLAEAVAN